MRTLYIIILLIIICLTACNHQKSNETKGFKTLRVGIDYTGSYSLFKQGINDFSNSIESLGPNTKIILRTISNDSYISDNLIESFNFPPLKNVNPFSKSDRKLEKDVNEKLKEVKLKLNEVLQNLNSKKYNRTDIDGFLLYCVENLEPEHENIIVLISDMQQNVEKYTNVLEKKCSKKKLEGVKIYVMAYDAKSPEIRNYWENKLQKYGASIKFIEPGNTMKF